MSEWSGDSSALPSGLPRGSIVAIGDAVAGFILLGHQSFATGRKLVDGNALDQISLTLHQAVDPFLCVANTPAKLCNLRVVSDIALSCCLPRPDKRVVLLGKSFDRRVQFL